jgi:TolB-like protein/Flp pilus assembly protein TadD
MPEIEPGQRHPMADDRTRRRLAAILAADVAGYSRLMEADEAGTLAALKRRRKEVLDPLVAKHQGRIFKIAGDGVLVEFASAVNAVACAVELQKRMAAANDGVAEERRLVLRIGINLGDVIVEGGDLYGEGVNIAARLEGIAEPGGILVSGTAYDHVRNKGNAGFDDLGAQSLKGIVEPVRVYRVTPPPLPSPASWGREASVSERVGAASLQSKPSVAVLPFVNMSGDPEQEYFSDGITEDIITELSRFRSLFVIARNSSFAFKGKAVKVQEIAKELGVAYVVEGSVRKAGARIRITVQLVEAAGGRHVWAERYDRPAEDVFAIQDEVVRTVAATLAGRLDAAGAEGLRRRPTASLSAYECVLRGNALPVGDPALEAVAHQLFEQAVALDPDYAVAHAQLAISHAKRWEDDMSGSSADLDRAFELAMRAVALDSQEIVCHTALGYIQLCRRRYDEAELHARKAVALNPNRPNALATLAFILTRIGQPDAAVALIADAMRLDPHHPTWYWTELGVAHFVARRYAEAVAAIRHRPTLAFFWHTYLAACHAQLGEEDAMRGAAAEIVRVRPDFSVATYTSHESFKLAADREHLASSLRKAGLPE